MSIARILVVEDESIVSRDIQNTLKKLGYDVAGAAANFEKALELAHSESPDLILMDIMLKGEKSGIDAAEAINSILNIPIIFLTAYADESTLSRAKTSLPYGYILKPFKEIDLRSGIEMAIYKHAKEKEIKAERDLLYSLAEGKDTTISDAIFVKSNSKLVKIKINDIYYVEALKDYVVINTISNRYTIHSTMKEIELKLSDLGFMRIHRSFIVRLDKIESIDYPNLSLEDNKKIIPIGGSYREEFNNRIRQV